MPRTMTRRDLADRVAAELNLSSTATVQPILDAAFDAILEHLHLGNRCEFRGFGVFAVKLKAARPARNPRTGDVVQVPDRRAITFKPSALLKNLRPLDI